MSDPAYAPVPLARSRAAAWARRARPAGVVVTFEADETLPRALRGDPDALAAVVDEALARAVAEASPGLLPVRLASGGFEGASARVDLHVGEGTAPVHRVLLPLGARPEPVAAPAAPEHLHVLIVEDEPVNRELLQAMIRSAGWSDEAVGTGGAGLERLRQPDGVDLALLDMHLPDLDGPEVARAAREAGVVLPLLAVTANAFAEDRRACLQAGMNDVLTKPVRREHLLQTIALWA